MKLAKNTKTPEKSEDITMYVNLNFVMLKLNGSCRFLSEFSSFFIIKG